MIELAGISKSFGDIQALKQVDLRIEKGRTTVLLGTSGCGKSTILRLILGLCFPEKGTVRFDGEPVTKETAIGIRRRIGYVAQEGGLFPHLTALKNVTLIANHLGWEKERIDARVEQLAALVSLDSKLLMLFPTELSGGQRQRIGLMRALMLEPDVLLMDEPLGALDPITRADLQRELGDIFARLKKTVLMVTHDLREADFFADLIVLMNAGQVVQQGKIGEMIRAPKNPFVSRFIQAQSVALGSSGGL